MKHSPVHDKCCPNPKCAFSGQLDRGNLVRHSFMKLKGGNRRLQGDKLLSHGGRCVDYGRRRPRREMRVFI